MSRLFVIFIVIKVVSSIVSPPQYLNTNNNGAIIAFGDSAFSTEKQFETIKNVTQNPAVRKYEPARKFIAHYNSLKSVTVLVDDTQESYNDAKSFMLRVFQVTPNAKYIPFSLQTFNTTGVSPPVEVAGKNTFDNLLEFKQSYGMPYLDPTKRNGTAAFFAILNAANALPPNSAILIFTDRNTADEYFAPYTSFLKEKNIKVYTIWGGPYPTKTFEYNLLRDLCAYSGGLFLVGENEKNLSDYYYRQYLSNKYTYMNTSVILSKLNLWGTTELTFPIDGKVTGIHVRITPFITNGIILTPRGRPINIFNENEVPKYSSGSFVVVETGLHQIHLNLTTAPTLDVGIWHLKLNNTHASYNITVFVYTELTAHAYFLEKNARYHNSTGNDRKVMTLGISVYNASISNISFVDKDGQPITDNVKYTPVKDSFFEENHVSDRQIDVEFKKVSKTPAYAFVQGKDSDGNQFSRLIYINSDNSNEIFPQPTLSIEVGAGSELITIGGKFPVILFEVTNHQSTVVDVRFTCKDDKSILRFLHPYRQIIGPQETAVVRLTLITRFGNYEDEITFTAWIGSESFQKKVIVDVGSQDVYDSNNPKLDYSFSSDCSKVIFSKCNEGTWTVKVTAKDEGSGLLRITTNRKGLYFSNGFTTGTRQEVVGYYSDSCCNPDLQITAVDRAKNREVINTNAYLSFWGPAQITALVLGIFILILVIILIIYLIRRCIRKKDNYNLPTYTGGRI